MMYRPAATATSRIRDPPHPCPAASPSRCSGASLRPCPLQPRVAASLPRYRCAPLQPRQTASPPRYRCAPLGSSPAASPLNCRSPVGPRPASATPRCSPPRPAAFASRCGHAPLRSRTSWSCSGFQASAVSVAARCGERQHTSKTRNAQQGDNVLAIVPKTIASLLFQIKGKNIIPLLKRYCFFIKKSHFRR